MSNRHSSKKAKSAGEIFNDIVVSIRASHDEDISDQEARQLARNFIGFCQKIIDIQIRIERETEKTIT